MRLAASMHPAQQACPAVSCCRRSPRQAVWLMSTTDADIPWLFFLPANCLEHGADLGVLGSLKLADKLLDEHGKAWRYFSSMAMIANTCRDLCQSLFSSWRALFDPSAVACVTALFPRCMGSVDQTKSRLLKDGAPGGSCGHTVARRPQPLHTEDGQTARPRANDASGSLVRGGWLRSCAW